MKIRDNYTRVLDLMVNESDRRRRRQRSGLRRDPVAAAPLGAPAARPRARLSSRAT